MKHQTQYKLEYKLLFSLVVAGKSAHFARSAMERFLAGSHAPTPLRWVNFLWQSPLIGNESGLIRQLKIARTGNYSKLEKAFRKAAEAVISEALDLRVCSPSELEKIPGIGPKTSRFFILWTRPNARCAALDTHILKWLKYLGYDAPKSTPVGKKYEELELAFLAEADKRGIPPAKLDEMIWTYCRDGGHKSGTWPVELQPINGTTQ